MLQMTRMTHIGLPALVLAVSFMLPLHAAEDAVVLPPPLDEAEYGEPEHCISMRSIRDTKILSSRHIAFRLTGKRYMLSTTRGECPFLHPRRVISLESHGSQLCNLDRVNVLERNGAINPLTIVRPEEAAGYQVIGSCLLGEFEPITEDQLDVLKESIAAAKKK